MNERDETHDPRASSWVPGADDHPDFPVQNLPLVRYRAPGAGDAGAAGMVIGDWLLELGPALDAGLLDGVAADHRPLFQGPLNALFAEGASLRLALRRAGFALLTDGAAQAHASACLRPLGQVELMLPARVSDYTDFYAGIHHARRVGALFRPDQPLLPNYRHVPIGYHGRASTLVPSGTPVRRPLGQLAGPQGPRFGPSERLDHEWELGIWVGPGNHHGTPVPIAQAARHIAGYGIVNDWSARDIQAWEYQPLGPFLAKSFATSVSPFVISPEALAPFRAPAMERAADDPRPLPYLDDPGDQASGALALVLETRLSTDAMRRMGQPPFLIASTTSKHLWWTPAQMLTHHSSNGCALCPGDLLATGTISGPGDGEEGSLLEATHGGRRPLSLPHGEERAFLEDGDEVILSARAEAEGQRTIGLGQCVGRVLPAPA